MTPKKLVNNIKTKIDNTVTLYIQGILVKGEIKNKLDSVGLSFEQHKEVVALIKQATKESIYHFISSLEDSTSSNDSQKEDMLFKVTNFMAHHQVGKNLLSDRSYKDGTKKSMLELHKKPFRTEIINYLLSKTRENGETTYLEIGVRNPDDNFNHIISDKKYGVDPGFEYKLNPVDYKMTSDEFFELLENNRILSSLIKFDLIFIDGLHLADQVDKDIMNAMRYIKDSGFIVLHDCNPPTEWHSRENYSFHSSPAGPFWNGTTWKAFLKWRFNTSVNSCCIDADWGVGILSKKWPIGKSIKRLNHFFEYDNLLKNRKEYLNLISYNELKDLLTLE